MSYNKTAFPIVYDTWNNVLGMRQTKVKLGMTLLDYFAARAMQAGFTAELIADNHIDYDRLARSSYEVAKEMMKERERIMNEESKNNPAQ